MSKSLYNILNETVHNLIAKEGIELVSGDEIDAQLADGGFDSREDARGFIKQNRQNAADLVTAAKQMGVDAYTTAKEQLPVAYELGKGRLGKFGGELLNASGATKEYIDDSILSPIRNAWGAAREGGDKIYNSDWYQKNLHSDEPRDVDITGSEKIGSTTVGRETPAVNRHNSGDSGINPWVAGGIAAAIPTALAGGYGALALRRKLAAQKRK